MSENKHTPEPWRTDAQNGFSQDVHDADGNLVAACSEANFGDSNARRITACVNACAGIPTYQLMAENDNPTNIGEVIDAIRDQRDDLLAAFERFMDSHEECTDFDGFAAQIVSMADYHQAQEAIESVKGEQP